MVEGCRGQHRPPSRVAQQPLDRRVLIAGAAGAAVAGGTAVAQAQQPPREKGPRVWMDMDQKELDDAYDQAKYAPNLPLVLKRYATASDETRKRIGAPKRLSYGPTPAEALDLYPTKAANAPINIFIHGGAWRGQIAKDYAFPAEALTRAGAHYVVLDFINVTQTDGNLMPMAEQVRRAIAWVAKNAKDFGGDANRIYISGHSSGGHLGGVALITDWKAMGVPADVIKGAVLLSGMYDLKPVRLSARSSYVKFTDEIEAALSTQRHLDRVTCPVTLVHGSLETPEFQRQSRDFAAALKTAGKPAELIVGPNYNHFEIAETLANPFGVAGRAVIEQMKLKVG